MDHKALLGLLFRITRQQKIAYLVVDDDLKVVTHSQNVTEWIEGDGADFQGAYLPDLVPELLGVEVVLKGLSESLGETFELPDVHRLSQDGQDSYFALRAEPLAAGAIQVVLSDVTEYTSQTQEMQQQRNELRLLSARLNLLNEQIGYILKRFVPERIAQEMIDTHELPEPGGEGQVEATLFFADMRDYSGLSEQLTPTETIDLLNVYLSIIVEAVERNYGTVIQLVGDQVMAAFNVPEPLTDHTYFAARAALEARSDLLRYTNQSGLGTTTITGFGFGINAGPATAGYLGAKDRYQYTVIGDTTNVASHLCSQAAAAQILISEGTRRLLGDRVQAVSIGEMYLKRRHEPVKIYSLEGIV
jgi:class 3 adenylate cyclase